MIYTVETAKIALDNIIKKSRVHLYNPIQIGEILYRHRVFGDIDLDDLESYRSKSKHWRDQISQVLLGRVCNSSSKFQDDLFNQTAVPPEAIKVLALENVRTNGAVEAYIYSLFTNKHNQLSDALDKCRKATKENFYVENFINSFWQEAGLKRSLDKIYEIIVYSLFSTLVEALKLRVNISVDANNLHILSEFQDFAQMVMCIDASSTIATQEAKVYRVGVTNAADRGLDMYSNWGPAIQIKHLSLDVELAQNIVESISSDRIVIVCKDAERDVIVSLLTQIGWKSRIQSIITEGNLIDWYEKALRGQYSERLGDRLLSLMCNELTKEFPSIDELPAIIKNRHYELIHNDFWTI